MRSAQPSRTSLTIPNVMAKEGTLLPALAPATPRTRPRLRTRPGPERRGKGTWAGLGSPGRHCPAPSRTHGNDITLSDTEGRRERTPTRLIWATSERPPGAAEGAGTVALPCLQELAERMVNGRAFALGVISGAVSQSSWRLLGVPSLRQAQRPGRRLNRGSPYGHMLARPTRLECRLCRRLRSSAQATRRRAATLRLAVAIGAPDRESCRAAARPARGRLAAARSGAAHRVAGSGGKR
jgi:hypothetical protein